jgi:hypothetical protein
MGRHDLSYLALTVGRLDLSYLASAILGLATLSKLIFE